MTFPFNAPVKRHLNNGGGGGAGFFLVFFFGGGGARGGGGWLVLSLFLSCVSITNIGSGCMHSEFNRIK